MKKGPSQYAEYWTSEYNEGRHFGEHGKQMGYEDNFEGKGGYSKEAQEFAEETGDDILSFIANESKNYATYKYKESTNQFMIISREGKIVTYFPPRDGIDYFNNQFDKYGDHWN